MEIKPDYDSFVERPINPGADNPGDGAFLILSGRFTRIEIKIDEEGDYRCKSHFCYDEADEGT